MLVQIQNLDQKFLGMTDLSSKPIFFLITADDCGACVTFKKNVWPVVKKQLEDSKSVNIVHKNIEFRRDRDKLVPEFGPDILKFVPHYPSMSLITADSWKEKKKLDGVIFNMSPDMQGNFVPLPADKRLGFDKLPEWVKTNLQLPPFKTTTRAVLVHDVTEGPVKQYGICTRDKFVSI